MSCVKDTLKKSLSRDRWQNLSYLFRRFLEFKQKWEACTGNPLEMDLAIVLWVERLREMDCIANSSALQYSYDIVSALQRMAYHKMAFSMLLEDYRGALKRLGALKPKQQAVPACPEEVEETLRQTPSPVLKLAISMCWLGAARASDVLRLRAEEVVTREDGVTSVNWVTTKSDPFRIGQQTGLNIEHSSFLTLKKLLKTAKRSRDTLIFKDVTFQHINTALKKVNPTLTPHSLRRGACYQLLKEGMPLEEIQKVSRHKTIEGLLRYLPAAGIRRVADTASLSQALRIKLDD